METVQSQGAETKPTAETWGMVELLNIGALIIRIGFPLQGSLKEVCKGSIVGFYNIGVRIGFPLKGSLTGVYKGSIVGFWNIGA